MTSLFYTHFPLLGRIWTFVASGLFVIAIVCFLIFGQVHSPVPLSSHAPQVPFNLTDLLHTYNTSQKLPSFGSELRLQLPAQSAQRWAAIQGVFDAHNPGQPLYTSVDSVQRQFFETTSCKRPSRVHLKPEQVRRAHESHASFLKQLPELAEVFSFPESRGIVTTAGGKVMPILVVSLKMLRRTGCTLPVEVFISSFDEYEPKLCEKVLPSLNAKCVILADDILDVTLPGSHPAFHPFQVKPFAILMSSFNEVLFLDADSFPVINPESLFETKPFIDKGLVIWPDFWCPTQSHLFYEITSTPLSSMNRASSESGQILYNKNRHVEDLLLTCYYNYYGPALWWKLLSQGYPGEGDKETYLAAASVLNAPFYQNKQVARKLPESGTPDYAIQQVNPADDYNVASNDWHEISTPPAILHHHWPKLNAMDLMDAGYGWASHHTRMWGSKEQTVQRFGLDLEHEVWKAVEYTACDVGDMFRTWRGRELYSSCWFVREHIRAVFTAGDERVDLERSRQR